MSKTLPIWLAGLAFLVVPHHGPLEGDARQQSLPASGVLVSPPQFITELPSLLEGPGARADFGEESPSRDARQIADWVLKAGDHQGRPFAIVDKVEARVFVFDASGRLQGAAPALLGLAEGDDSVPGIGERPVLQIEPHERTTPAGRFVAEPGLNAKGEDIVWVDYENAISMHRVRPIDPREQRLERLASSTPTDNRISYGCINLPASFYDTVLSPLIGQKRGIVYVLPETRTVTEVFGPYGFGPQGGATTWRQASSDKKEADDAFWQTMMAR